MDDIARTPYTKFNSPRMVPRNIYYQGKLVPDAEIYSSTLWIERPEDWYALEATSAHEYVLVIRREDFLAAPSSYLRGSHA